MQFNYIEFILRKLFYYLCMIFNVSTAKIEFFIIISLAKTESNIVYNDLRQVIQFSIFSEIL